MKRIVHYFPHRILAVAFLALLCALVGKNAYAADLNAFDQANQEFAAGHFLDAAKGFEQVIAQDGYSAPVLFNLGNAYLKADEPGRAILNYERAQMIAPHDVAISHNLQLARKQAGIATNESLWRNFLQTFAWNTLSWIGLVATLIIGASVFASRIVSSFPKNALYALLTSGTITLVTVVAIVAARWPELNRSVVLDRDTPAYIAPVDATAVLFKLPAGETLTTRQSHNGFVLVRTNEGLSGWISRKQIESLL